MALKTEKYRKYYLKCSNTFFADCICSLTLAFDYKSLERFYFVTSKHKPFLVKKWNTFQIFRFNLEPENFSQLLSNNFLVSQIAAEYLILLLLYHISNSIKILKTFHCLKTDYFDTFRRQKCHHCILLSHTKSAAKLF